MSTPQYLAHGASTGSSDDEWKSPYARSMSILTRPVATKRAPQSYQRLKEQLEGRADSR